MSVNSKHLATFLLGAAAAFGAYKYANMTDEEKEKMAAALREKAKNLKDSAMDAEDKALEYFAELKTKGTDSFKEYMPKVEEFFESLFNKGGAKPAADSGTPGANGPTTHG
ncbi:MAG: hypothetical protein JWP69_2402 [Flaviaesturariibacter sp.]|nr:hypothetical protein [Flaviaesturariibacter sp.]